MSPTVPPSTYAHQTSLPTRPRATHVHFRLTHSTGTRTCCGAIIMYPYQRIFGSFDLNRSYPTPALYSEEDSQAVGRRTPDLCGRHEPVPTIKWCSKNCSIDFKGQLRSLLIRGSPVVAHTATTVSRIKLPTFFYWCGRNRHTACLSLLKKEGDHTTTRYIMSEGAAI